MDINNLLDMDTEFLIIGLPMKSNIEKTISSIIGRGIIWEDNASFLVLTSSNMIRVNIFIYIENMLKGMGLKYRREGSSISIENNSIFVCNFKKEDIPLCHEKYDMVYVHEYANEPEVSFYFEKLVLSTEKMWISTLDYDDSIIYDTRFRREDKIIVSSEKAEAYQDKISNSTNIYSDEFIREALGHFKLELL